LSSEYIGSWKQSYVESAALSGLWRSFIFGTIRFSVHAGSVNVKPDRLGVTRQKERKKVGETKNTAESFVRKKIRLGIRSTVRNLKKKFWDITLMDC
jgi:hypothetical protein